MNGKKAKYTVFVPRVTHDPGLAERALSSAMSGGVVVDHGYLDRDKLAHWPGGQPEIHDLVHLHADETPEMDSHVKQLARQIAQAGQLPTIFATRSGSKGHTHWTVDNPDLLQT